MFTTRNSIYVALVAIIIVLLFRECQRGETHIKFDRDKAAVHHISLESATFYRSNFKRGQIELSQKVDTNYLKRNFDLPQAETFNRDAIAELLDQDNVKGMRIYLGRDSVGRIRFVLVGVSASGKDIINGVESGGLKAMKSQLMMLMPPGDDNNYNGLDDNGQRCEPMCDLTSQLDHN